MTYFDKRGVMLSAAVFSGGAKHLARIGTLHARSLTRLNCAEFRDDASQFGTLWLNRVLYGT